MKDNSLIVTKHMIDGRVVYLSKILPSKTYIISEGETVTSFQWLTAHDNIIYESCSTHESLAEVISSSDFPSGINSCVIYSSDDIIGRFIITSMNPWDGGCFTASHLLTLPSGIVTYSGIDSTGNLRQKLLPTFNIKLWSSPQDCLVFLDSFHDRSIIRV